MPGKNIDLYFDFRIAPGSSANHSDSYGEALDMIRYADSSGLSRVIVSEHHFTEDGYCSSPLLFAAAVAAVTTDIEICVAAIIAPFYDPVRLAEDIVMLDNLSRGRVHIVLVPGYDHAEFSALGLDFSRRGELFDSSLDVLMSVLRGETSNSGLTPPSLCPQLQSQVGDILSIGGNSNRAIDRCVRYDLGYFPGSRNAVQWLESYRSKMSEQGLRARSVARYWDAQSDQEVTQLNSIVFAGADLDKMKGALEPLADYDNRFYENISRGIDGHKEAVKNTQELSLVPDSEIDAFLDTRDSFRLSPLYCGVDPGFGWDTIKTVAGALLSRHDRKNHAGADT